MHDEHAPSDAAQLAEPPTIGDPNAWALFVDVDGTLVGYEPHPDAVRIEPHARATILTLRERLGGALAVISGRRLDDIDRLFAPLVLPAAGLHGLERRDPDGKHCAFVPAPLVADMVRRQAEDAVAALCGVWLEDKGSCFALHYRSAPHLADEIQEIAAEIAAASNGDYVVQAGECVAELKPAGADKGTALFALLSTEPFSGRRPIMLGDDLTDEAAFRMACNHGGFGVVVGSRRPTHARYGIATPDAALSWLARFAHVIELHEAVLS
jgi:trehalose 6-phosphate phosphatase